MSNLTPQLEAGYARRREGTSSKINQAIERLVKGFPTHPDFKDSIVQITVSTVAKEAGVSRTRIYSDPEILKMIKTLERHRSQTGRKTKAAIIQAQREIIASQEIQIRDAVSQNAAVLKRCLDAEKRARNFHLRNQELTKLINNLREPSTLPVMEASK